MVDSQSQALNLQHGDQVIRSLLEEWIAKQAQGRKTKDQTDRKAFPYLDDDTSWRRSYLSPSIASLEASIESPSATSPVSSIDPDQRANIQGAASNRAAVGRQALRTVVRGLIVAIIVGAVWQVYRDDQTKELIKTWGQSSLIWASSVLGSTQRSSELAAEPGSTLSDQAVTPTPVAIGDIPELQLQLQTLAGDLAVLQRIVEQVASKQEQISRDIATLQATEQNINEKISSLTQAAAVHAPPRRNVAKLVHSETPKQPAASPLPLEIPPAETPSVAAIPPAAETPSPANQPPRPPLPLTQPVGTPSAAH